MEFLSDPVVLSRIQFAIVVIFHFLFVPLSIGLGLFVALAETRYYRSGDPKDKAATHFWAKIFTTTFVVGVATGITMEFSFGTNWADYSRFVGDIFGSPLAAEALLAFFLESIFLGIVLFGRNRVGKKVYLASAWLVFGGSVLSALWILIANSWMQTPAGFVPVDATGAVVPAADAVKAQMVNFWQAAFNPSTVARYLHTVDALLILGSFIVIAVGAYYIWKGKNADHGKKFMKTGIVVGIITVILMLPFAHMQATTVAANQPAKMAAMEGQTEDGPMPLSLIGYVDSTGQAHAFPSIPGGTSFLASWNFDTVYPGLNTLDRTPEQIKNDAPIDLTKANADGQYYSGLSVDSYRGGTPPVQITFQAYHLMVALYLLLIVWLILAGIGLKKARKDKISKGLLVLVVLGPIIPFLCIQSGWLVTEIGRQPWVVYDLLLTQDAVSRVVSAPELIITILLFIVFYLVLFISWLRLVLGQIKKGPEAALPASVAAADAAAADAALSGAGTVGAVAAASEVSGAEPPANSDSKGGE